MLRVILFLACASVFAQRPELSVDKIPENLLQNSNAVVRDESLEITISSRSSLTVKRQRTVTVLSKAGLEHLRASEYRPLRDISAIIYDKNGKEIRKFRRKDFKSRLVSDWSEINDTRVTYLDFVPTEYPFTMVYTSEVADANTAFIPQWIPVHDFLVAVEKASVKVVYPEELGFKFKASNAEKFRLTEKKSPGEMSLFVENIPAVKSEVLAPPFDRIVPVVLFGLDKFHLEGVDGDAADWKAFGLWYGKLLSGTESLPQETRDRIKNLVGAEKDPLKIAAIVYKYVQDRTRYVSIQLGIGGWKPMKAEKVDKLGYGDCKALTNYTKSLLDAVGVQSYYTILHSSGEKRDIREDFVSVQGNHVMLALPVNGEYMLLECTNQTTPFGYLGNHADDRNVLVIKPEGGEMVRSGSYPVDQNLQKSVGSYSVDGMGKISGKVSFVSRGTQYNAKLQLESMDPQQIDVYYKNFFPSIANVKVVSQTINNVRESLEFIEEVEIASDRYADIAAGQMIFPVNAFNNNGYVPQRYRVRSNPLEIDRGYVDTDEYTIKLPEGYVVDARPSDFSIEGKFGQYSTRFEISGSELKYFRTLRIYPGVYTENEYNEYRSFRESIARADNAKIILKKA